MKPIVTVQVLRLNEVRAFVANKNRRATLKIPQAVKKAALFLHGEVKLSIAGRRSERRSVDTGRFLNTVEVEPEGKLNAIIFSRLPYAKSLEFNRSIMGGPRRHFNNSLDRNKQKIQRIIKEEMRDI